MAWRSVNTAWRDEDDERALISEELISDTGRCLGGIVRFYDNGPTYAWSHYGRIGPCGPPMPYVAGGPHPEPSGWECDAAARAAVERELERGGKDAR